MSTKNIILQLQDPSGAPLGNPFTSTITVSSLDPGVLQFSSATYSVTAGNNAALTVTRTSGTDGTVTVDYATSDGTAVAPGDYTTTSGTLTFSDGVTSQPISVPTIAAATSPIVWDAATAAAVVTLSNGARTASITPVAVSGFNRVVTTGSLPAGRYYAEIHVDTGATKAYDFIVGVEGTTSSSARFVRWLNHFSFINPAVIGYSVYADTNGDGHTQLTAFANNITIMIAIDTLSATRKVWFGRQGAWEASGNPATGVAATISPDLVIPTTGLNLSFANQGYSIGGVPQLATSVATLRLKGSEMSYAIPTGFSAWDPTEPAETFAVTLSSPTGGATLGSPTTATVTIS